MKLGLGVLRLAPESFWAMTPRELVAALGPRKARTNAMPRAALAALIERFPDRAGEEAQDDVRGFR